MRLIWIKCSGYGRESNGEKVRRSEEVKLWRTLEVMIRTLYFILCEMKSYWCILIGEVTI